MFFPTGCNLGINFHRDSDPNGGLPELVERSTRYPLDIMNMLRLIDNIHIYICLYTYEYIIHKCI